MMKLVIFSFTAMIFVFAVQAQETNNGYWMPLESRIGLAVGIGSVTYLDENSSPLVYRSRPKNIRLFYNLENHRLLFSADIDFRLGSNSPKNHPARILFFSEEDYKGETESYL